MAHRLSGDDAGISDWIVLAAIVLAVVVALGAYYAFFTPKPSAPARVAGYGDQVQVDYIGYFQSDNLVFDTSIQSVAQDNVTYPKAYSFTWRSSYTPLSFTIGSGAVVPGFDNGVRGLVVGESTTIVVPASQGYGAADPSKVFVYPLVQTVPVRVAMNQSAFQALYNAVAVSGSSVTDPVYGWTATVSISGGIVTVTNSPYPSEIIQPYGAWPAQVLGINDTANNGTGAITIQNHIDPSLVDKVGGTSGGQTFYLSAVDPSAGSYTLDFNKQVVGRTLVFQVTMVSISSSY